MNLLFICHANLCRSFIAQEVAKKYLPDAVVFSRGLYVDPTLRVPQKVLNFLQEQHISPTPHIAVQLSADDLEKADFVFCMEQEQLEMLLDRYAQHTDKIWLLSDFAFGKEESLEDPISFEGRAFTKLAARVADAAQKAVQKISAGQ